MPLFEQTQLALSELSASRQYDFGIHSALQVKAGVPGRDVGEFPFDPAKHSPADIYPFSLMEQVTDMPHVRMVIPSRPLEANVIVHYDDSAHDDPRIVSMKHQLAYDICQSMEVTLPGMTDRATVYELGHTTIDDDPEPGIEVVDVENNDPLVAAQTVAEFCAGALTFVISDFKRLPLEQIEADYSSAIAIKTNHLAEMELPPNVGIISVGDAAEVNTNKPKELADFNADLTEKHRQIIERLKSTGLAVVQVVFDRKNHPQFGFDIAKADQEIADAALGLEA